MSDTTNPCELKIKLARIVVDGTHRSTPRDVHALHRYLWRPWSDGTASRAEPTTEARPYLFRADRVKREDGALVVKILLQLQTNVAPDWSRLNLLVEKVEEAEICWNLSVGQRIEFFLRANPTVQRKDKKQLARAVDVETEQAKTLGELGRDEFRAARGVRHAVRGELERTEWLEKKLALAGAKLATKSVPASDDFGRSTTGESLLREVRVSNQRSMLWKHKGTLATHEGVDFGGALEVINPAALAEAVNVGIGTAKAFGFGMLSLKV